jgi:hypothetical protein
MAGADWVKRVSLKRVVYSTPPGLVVSKIPDSSQCSVAAERLEDCGATSTKPHEMDALIRVFRGSSLPLDSAHRFFSGLLRLNQSEVSILPFVEHPQPVGVGITKNDKLVGFR